MDLAFSRPTISSHFTFIFLFSSKFLFKNSIFALFGKILSLISFALNAYSFACFIYSFLIDSFFSSFFSRLRLFAAFK